jgi:hypothetical protein
VEIFLADVWVFRCLGTGTYDHFELLENNKNTKNSENLNSKIYYRPCSTGSCPRNPVLFATS